MRVVILGATSLAVTTAHLLIKAGHEVVMIDRDAERIKELDPQLDCGFLKGDGSTPEVLKEADPGNTDILFCVTNHDQTNIIASLIGKSLGVPRVVTMIEDASFLPICDELGLKDTIIPVRMISQQLAGLAKA